jgi:hypothetical protein
MMTQTEASYDELLKELQAFNDNSHIMIHVPSVGEVVKFKPLSVKQQTSIITGVLTSDQSNNIYSYQNVIDRLIQENCDPDVVDQLMIFDRACILIQLRLHTIGDTITVDGQTYDLQQHVDTFAEHQLTEQILQGDMSYEGIKVTCQAPTLRVDHRINEMVPEIFSNTADKDSVGNIFLVELAKFITHVNFSGNNIDFSDLTLKQRVQICEMLPMTLSQQVVQYIESVREFEQPYVNIDTQDGTIEIPVDSQLFNR